MVLLLQLYIQFVKIGALGFGGGYAVIPLIQQFIVEEEAWLSMSEFTDLVSISQMTPGPIVVNSATFVGTKIHGIPGAIIATLGVVTPQLILMMILGYFLFSQNRHFVILDRILKGIRPGVIGLILIAAISMSESSLFPNGLDGGVEIIPAITFIIGLIAYAKKVDLIKLIGVGALCGVVLSLVI